ncbi:MAG TPA: hypothetical protein PKB02_10030 [Anaerohalosphaeraceae bacterium]|nr:hypothetical protein [Anaerohalosphaeraceae bacterium]
MGTVLHYFFLTAMALGFLCFALSFTKSLFANMCGRMVVASIAFILSSQLGFGLLFAAGMGHAFSPNGAVTAKDQLFTFLMGAMMLYFIVTGLGILLVKLSAEFEKIIFMIHFVGLPGLLILASLFIDVHYSILSTFGVPAFCYVMLWFRIYETCKTLKRMKQ